MPKPNNVVQLNSRAARIERQIDVLLDMLEDTQLPIVFKERVACLYTIMRIQALISKGGKGDGAGSAVRKYASAFAAKDGTSRGKGVARTVARSLDLEDDDEPDLAG